MRRALKRSRLMLILASLALVLAGCGGGDEEQAEVQPAPAQQSGQMVPAGMDTANAHPAGQMATEQEVMDPAGEGHTPDGQPAGQGVEQTPVGDPSGAEVAPAPARSPSSASAAGGDTPGAASPAPAGVWSLQLGSFGNEANATARAGKIEELGHSATVEKAMVKGQQYHRVFVRGLASRQAAENIGEDLRAELGISYLVLHR